MIYEEIFQSPLSTKYFVDRYIEELESPAQRQPKGKEVLVRGPVCSWIPPPEGLMKINLLPVIRSDTSLGRRPW